MFVKFPDMHKRTKTGQHLLTTAMFHELTNRVGSEEIYMDQKCDLYTVQSTVRDCINGIM
jgi:hypothetical protein